MKDIGVAISDKNLPGIPQYDILDFFNSLIIFETSNGDVLNLLRGSIIFLGVSVGVSSSLLGTLDLEEKCLLRISRFCLLSLITLLFSDKGGIF